MTPDMKAVASVSANGSLRIWDMEVGTSSVATKPGQAYTQLHLAGGEWLLTVTDGATHAAVVSPKDKAEVLRLDARSAIRTALVHPKACLLPPPPLLSSLSSLCSLLHLLLGCSPGCSLLHQIVLCSTCLLSAPPAPPDSCTVLAHPATSRLPSGSYRLGLPHGTAPLTAGNTCRAQRR